MQVHALREDFREKNSSTNQHIIRLESLQAEVSLPMPQCGKAEECFSHWGRCTGSLDKEPSELGNRHLLCIKRTKISKERHFCGKLNGEHLIHVPLLSEKIKVAQSYC